MPSLDELKDYALSQIKAAAGGAANEATLGLTSPYKEDVSAHPYTSGAARVASYFVPGLGEEELAGKVGLKTLGKLPFLAESGLTKLAGSSGEALMKHIPDAGGGLLKKIVGGSAAAGTQAGAQNLLGYGAGKETGEEAAKNTIGAAEFGGGAGVLGGLLKNSAKAIYSHPMFKSGIENIDQPIIQKMMDESFIGGKQGAKDLANNWMNRFKSAKDEIVSNAANRESDSAAQLTRGGSGTYLGLTDLSPLMPDVQKMRLAGVPEGEIRAALSQARGAAGALSEGAKGQGIGYSSIPQVDAAIKAVNEKLTNLSPKQGGTLFGLLNGTAPKELESLKDIRGRYNETLNRSIDRFGNPGDAGELAASAKTEYRPGRNLQKNISGYENNQPDTIGKLLQNPAKSADKALLGGAAAAALTGHPIIAGLAGAGAALQSPTARTFLGLQAAKASPTNFGALTGKDFSGGNGGEEEKSNQDDIKQSLDKLRSGKNPFLE